MARDAEEQSGPAPALLGVELLYESPPTLDPESLWSDARRALPGLQLISEPAKQDMILFAHTDHPIRYAEGKEVPAQTVIFTAAPEDHAKHDAAIQADIQHTYDWPAAAKVAAKCRFHVSVIEMMARMLDHQTRLRLFQTVLLAVVERTRPAAIRWISANKLTDPAALLRASGSANPSDLFFQAVNVRMFRITSRSEGEMVMDSVGLAPFGLPDLQMHFRDLDVSEVAGHLYNCAAYIFQRGDVIQDGNTIGGLRPQDKWRCQHEMALVGPERLVLDIDPGPPFAAGGRGERG